MDNVLPAAQALLLTTAARWMNLVDKVPEALLAARPAPDAWSALECLRHLLDTEAHVFPVRVRSFLIGEDIANFDPDTEGAAFADLNPTGLAAEFAHRRAESLAMLEDVKALDLARTARHSALGEVTLGQMLHEWAAHDLAHTMQAEQALMQPFIAGAGPWRPTFRDHDLQGDGA
jgi:hypothetical protein